MKPLHLEYDINGSLLKHPSMLQMDWERFLQHCNQYPGIPHKILVEEKYIQAPPPRQVWWCHRADGRKIIPQKIREAIEALQSYCGKPYKTHIACLFQCSPRTLTRVGKRCKITFPTSQPNRKPPQSY